MFYMAVLFVGGNEMRKVTALLYENVDDQGQIVIVEEERDVDVRAYMSYVIGDNCNPYYIYQKEPDMPQFIVYGIENAPRPFVIVLDNKGKYKHLPATRVVLRQGGIDVLAGKFLVLAVEGDTPEDMHPDSLTDEEIEIVRKHFATSHVPQEERDELRNSEYWKELGM